MFSIRQFGRQLNHGTREWFQHWRKSLLLHDRSQPPAFGQSWERTSLSLPRVIPLTPVLLAQSCLTSCTTSFPAKHEISRKQRWFRDYTVLLPSTSLLMATTAKFSAKERAWKKGCSAPAHLLFSSLPSPALSGSRVTSMAGREGLNRELSRCGKHLTEGDEHEHTENVLEQHRDHGLKGAAWWLPSWAGTTKCTMAMKSQMIQTAGG